MSQSPSRVIPQVPARERAASVPLVSQPSEAAPLIPQVGGFALKALANVKAPEGLVKQ